MVGNERSLKEQLSMVIQERDRHLLREAAVMRVIDREQAKIVAGFGSTTRANARLLASLVRDSSAGSFSARRRAERKPYMRSPRKAHGWSGFPRPGRDAARTRRWSPTSSSSIS